MDITRKQEERNYRSGGLDYPAPHPIEKQLLALNEEIDQLASTAGDIDMCGEIKAALDLAWWLTEDLMRVHCGVGSCGHRLMWSGLVWLDVERKYCSCCGHYMELYPKCSLLRGRL